VEAKQVKSLEIKRADNFLSRMRGLLFRKALVPGEALHIVPCNSVHTFFMFYAIDVVFLNREGLVLKVVKGLRPWRVAMCLGSFSVVELLAGEAENLSIKEGEVYPWLS